MNGILFATGKRRIPMPTELTLRDKLEYLVRLTGQREADMLAAALEEGLSEVYRQRIASAYLAGKINREEAVTRLGEESIQDLDYAREAVTRDVEWGLSRE